MKFSFSFDFICCKLNELLLQLSFIKVFTKFSVIHWDEVLLIITGKMYFNSLKSTVIVFIGSWTKILTASDIKIYY